MSLRLTRYVAADGNERELLAEILNEGEADNGFVLACVGQGEVLVSGDNDGDFAVFVRCVFRAVVCHYGNALGYGDCHVCVCYRS